MQDWIKFGSRICTLIFYPSDGFFLNFVMSLLCIFGITILKYFSLMQ